MRKELGKNSASWELPRRREVGARKKWGVWAARVLGEGCKSNSKRVNGKAGTKGIGLTEKTKEKGAGRTAQKRGVWAAQ